MIIKDVIKDKNNKVLFVLTSDGFNKATKGERLTIHKVTDYGNSFEIGHVHSNFINIVEQFLFKRKTPVSLDEIENIGLTNKYNIIIENEHS